ncbi:MAG TPA: GNAT family N-acetyltransferase [Kineosporiaceae bacterium]|nr:GNAT family N-acetyltransferase [Kineosporiaceae bacterium]
MTIRPRRPEDLPPCVAVLAEVHRVDGYPEIWQPDAIGWVDPPGTIAAWVAEPAGAIVGHVSLMVAPAGGETVKLSRLFVAPSAQGQGLARQLMATAVAWAEDQGRDVVLEVYAGTPAVTLYEGLGWRFLGSSPASWLGAQGQRPTLRFYAAPGNRSPDSGSELLGTDHCEQP